MDKSFKVLLVEDTHIGQIAAQLILESFPCVLDIAADGKQALQAVTQQQYDLIFMDLGLPDMDGFETTEHIRKIDAYKMVPIVALTGHGEPSYRQRAADSGMTDFLEKPLTFEKATLIFEQLCLL